MTRSTRTDVQIVANRLSRLNLEAQEHFEYATQIIDTYQAKINVRQNKVMQILTIVTTIFMPLTLITGWYGMNFNIPENNVEIRLLDCNYQLNHNNCS